VNTGSFEITLSKTQAIKYIVLQEYIRLGQRVKAFTVEAWQDGGWKQVAEGTTIGYKRILPMQNVNTNKLRVNITDSKASLVLSNVELY
jgi:Alpha-L-fucosidase